LGNLALAYSALGQFHLAVAAYQQRIDVAREIGDRPGEAKALGNLGNTYSDMGETGLAIRCHKHNLAIAIQIGDRKGQAYAAWNLGLMYVQENPARAVEFMQLRVNFLREIGHPYAETDAAYVAAIRARIAP
jgi:tetratricopeptide (TPR) repeat protein